MIITSGEPSADIQFSVAERDLRWGRTRELMARDEIDVIVCLPCSNNHARGAADALYLTQLGENSEDVAVCFPIEGEVTAWIQDGAPRSKATWISDLRPLVDAPGTTISNWLRDRGPHAGSGKVGIAGLTGGLLAHCREAEGEANWGSVNTILTSHTGIQIASATDLLGEVRYTKSEEEILCLRRATLLAEQILDSVTRTIKPGVAEREVFGEMMFTNAIAGGSFTPMFGWISGPSDNLYHRVEQPSLRKFALGDKFILEVDGRYSSYIAQIDHTYTIGPASSDNIEGMELVLEAFANTLAAMKPGVTVEELMSVTRLEGMNGRAVVNLGMHGRGTGDDGPLVTPRLYEGVSDVVLAENSVMCVKPSATIDGRGYGASWGDTVLVTKTGGVRLGERIPGLTEIL